MTAQLYVVRQLSSDLVPVLRSHQTKSSMIIQLRDPVFISNYPAFAVVY